MTIVAWAVALALLFVAAVYLIFLAETPRIDRAITDVLDADEPDDVDVAARLAPYTALRLSPTVSVHDFAGDDCPVCKGEK